MRGILEHGRTDLKYYLPYQCHYGSTQTYTTKYTDTLKATLILINLLHKGVSTTVIEWHM